MSNTGFRHSCSYTEDVFNLLGKRWMGPLIDLLLQRPARFSEIHAALPALSKRVLSDRLSELQEVGWSHAKSPLAPRSP
ncbi:helix-turn-helix transcriptional regulator [Streptomyces sp. NBC_00841]|uniref:winged helix-turn-helix transcriptional regulator n=1 Tax=Streptomyces sp. NBC_00841 TaxID=2975847 RepID=UPI002DD97216|nr:helix-turn-helix domain-containing protein [Streptomyces sp. NBC_00841]WRZ96771.1 helix-turn-helix transcriptional regulator [Streptomyces sp. NBC_00841]